MLEQRTEAFKPWLRKDDSLAIWVVQGVQKSRCIIVSQLQCRLQCGTGQPPTSQTRSPFRTDHAHFHVSVNGIKPVKKLDDIPVIRLYPSRAVLVGKCVDVIVDVDEGLDSVTEWNLPNITHDSSGEFQSHVMAANNAFCNTVGVELCPGIL